MTTTNQTGNDPFKAIKTLSTPLGERKIYDLNALRGVGEVSKLPYSIKVLLEACLRHLDNYVVTEEHVKALAAYDPKNVGEQEIPFNPGRVVLQDFTGVPAVVDLAAMRAGIVRMTEDDANRDQGQPRLSPAIWSSTTPCRSTRLLRAWRYRSTARKSLNATTNATSS